MVSIAPRSRLLLALAIALTFVVAGCYEEPIAMTTLPPEDQPTEQPTPEPATPEPSIEPATPQPPPTSTPLLLTTPTPAPIGTPIALGSPSPGCVSGWVGPLPGTPEYDEGIAILEGYMGVVGPWTVTEMRYFIGPDSPGVIEPRFDVVERWYIRAALVSDAAFGGRWLIEKRTDEILGVSAVAPWESFGYESPDWTGFIGEGEPQTYIGLPGQWSGIPFDFVTGDGDGGQPGLPPEVVDCLAAT
ncbi:MAG: hypothetical protein WD830_08650 [Chloroflexota bacterium]